MLMHFAVLSTTTQASRAFARSAIEVDFFWPDLGLVVETDGWRYHRTPAAQSRDARRDQAHTASGLTPLRFSHHQVKYEPAHVKRILTDTAAHLRA
jgi:very-short-patch-repair endonuclease